MSDAAPRRRPRVLVTDASRGSALSIIRSLGRRGFDVLAADPSRLSPGMYSRYATARFVYPNPVRQPAAAVDALVNAARDRQIDLLIPVNDETILPLSDARSRFDRICRLALPSAAALNRVIDKHATLELAADAGVPAPRSYLVRNAAEGEELGARMGWPVVLKPRASKLYLRERSIESFAVTYAEDREQLIQQLRRFEGRSEILLQEYCRGEAHGVGVLFRDGEPLVAFQHRRLHEVPLTGGGSSFRESVALNATLFDYAVRLLAPLRWTGPAMVEFKMTSDGPKLMEINGRPWGSLPLAVKSGVDFPGLWADLFVPFPNEARIPPLGSYSLRVRSRNLELELIWIASVLLRGRRYRFEERHRRLEAIVAALRLFYPRDGYDVLEPSDPVPAAIEIARILRTSLRMLRASRPGAVMPRRITGSS